MKSLIVTDSGNELIARVIAGETTISFTRIAVSDCDYSKIDVKQIKDLQQIKQTVPISKISRLDKNMIEVLAAVENRQVEEPYFVYALGIYAKDSNKNEILYGVSLCDENPDYMPAYEGKVLSGISYRLDIVVGDSEQVVLDVNPAAVATILQVEQIENDLIRHTSDVAEIRKEYAKKTEVPKLVKVDNKTVFLSDDGILSAKAGITIAPKNVYNTLIINGDAEVTISWTDPDDTVIDGVTFSTWAGTKIVMKEGSYPTNELDGTVVLDSTTRNAYQSKGYTITGLTNRVTYYFALFTYSTDEIFNYAESGRLLGKPGLVKLDACTNMKTVAAMGEVTVTWSDPAATKTVDGNTATWKKTVLVYKEGTTAPTTISDGTIAVEETTRNAYQSKGYTITGLIDGNDYSFSLFAISTDDYLSDAISASVKLYTTLTITAKEISLYGKEVKVTNRINTVTGIFDSSGSITLKIPWIGSTIVSSTDGTDTAAVSVNISEYDKTYNVELLFITIVTFADGTNEEIAAMIDAHYNNKINIADYWAVGDKRKVNLSAMSATDVGESHRAQAVEFAIADFDHDELVTAINGHTKAAVTLTQVDCLMDAECASGTKYGSSDTESGYINSSSTNVGGWESCARRTWCNSVYYNALPSALKNAVKEVNKKTSAGNQSTTIKTTTDKIFLLSEIEIFGSITYSVSGEGKQYQYYKNAVANRYKLPKRSSSYNSNIWWQRSPHSRYGSFFLGVNGSGSANSYDACISYGIVPCFCL